jgi:hypothetical protein
MMPICSPACKNFTRGKRSTFDGTYGFPNDIVTKTALRIALRAVNDVTKHPDRAGV